ncbi:MAG TPA: GWxTD domain-containing protein, partial [Thermoanaerobaculia bacterium]|nr:GWxTD domain-containing protein [Thermoanaerobaculia bacterium]
MKANPAIEAEAGARATIRRFAALLTLVAPLAALCGRGDAESVSNTTLTPVPAAATATTAAPAASAPNAPANGPSRSGEALRLFGKLEDDRSLVYIASGAPDARQTVSCPSFVSGIEVWTYLEHPILGTNARVLFFPEAGTGTYRYWTVLEGEAVLRPATKEKGSAASEPISQLDPAKSGCPETALLKTALKDIAKRQQDHEGGLAERSRLAVPHIVPPVNETAKAPTLVSNKPLTGSERKRLLAELPDRYRQFIEDVEPIITPLERDTFLKLTTEYQRDRFLDDFWKRRSLAPDGTRVAFRDIYELRLREAKERYHGLRTDQGRIYIVNGPPDGIRKIDCTDIYNPIEIWYYERLESMRLSKVILLFYQPFGVGAYKLWSPIDGATALLVGGLPGMAGLGRRVDVSRCQESRDIQAAMSVVSAIFGSTGGALKFIDDLREGPKPDSEGADQILQMTTDVDASATPLPIQRVLRFPEMIANKMRVEIAVMLERNALAKKQIGEESFYDIDVVGEIVKGNKLVDNFRYRFDFPVSTVNGSFVPLTVERELYPGDYQLKVKVADANRNSASVISEKVNVPETPDASLTPEEKAAREAAKAAITRMAERPNDPKGSLSFVPLAREIATGLVRFETRATSADIAFTEFFLDNTRVVTKRRPPFDADLDLGSLPRRHAIKVIGYAKSGQAIAEDEMILNEGREAFRVRIASPDKTAVLQGATRVVADVAVPETKRLKNVEMFVNEHKVATLWQAPFEQVVDIPKTHELGFVRVVANLDDGSATEDLRYFNA